MIHYSVLVNEILEGLNLTSGDIVVDGTVNGGGHAKAICDKLDGKCRIFGFDQDRTALDRAVARLDKCNFTPVESNFRFMRDKLAEQKVTSANRVLFDLGLSSNQFEESGRGFSFQKEEPLLMTFRETPDESAVTAREIVNLWEEENIAAILYGYGEEQFARKIARAIAEARTIKPIETTTELVAVIQKAVPSWYGNRRINPATKTFQALRITVNDEIGSLHEGLAQGFDLLAPQGRMAVIAFHSGEDRIVKNFFRDKAQAKEGLMITKKPIVPSDRELHENPRSRSAKLRIIEKVIN